MSGKSDLSPMCMKYYRKLTSGAMIVVGSFLLLEHLFNFGGFDIELLGHEYYGLFFILFGFGLSLKREQIRGVIDAWKNRNWHGVIDEGERE